MTQGGILFFRSDDVKRSRIGDCSFEKNITLWSISCDICGEKLKTIDGKKIVDAEWFDSQTPFYAAINHDWIVMPDWFAICPKCLKSIGE